MKKSSGADSKRPAVPEKWGPSEWFGHDVATVSRIARLDLARDAMRSAADANRCCPYLSELVGADHACSKPGGVCSVQRYSQVSPGDISLTGHRVAICPSRLVSRSVLHQIARIVLGPMVNPVLVKEVPYSVSLTKIKKNGEPTAAGRIDWLLVDPADPKNFCAVETQSVYMSGKTQKTTFEAFIHTHGEMAMPPQYRHPDYKSSVPKRLAPQLESKARHLSSTSRKTVVLVDEFVLENMTHLHEVSVPAAYGSDAARTEQHKLETSEVIFAIVSLKVEGLNLERVLYCKINEAKDALNAVSAMSQSRFEDVVRELVHPKPGKTGKAPQRRAGKVFDLS